jgi:predicted small lipoprotein YifL
MKRTVALPTLALAVLVFAAGALSACGQMGPLTLPQAAGEMPATGADGSNRDGTDRDDDGNDD